MQLKNGWTSGQFRIWRVCFGLYLFYHFAGLLPWGPELFSSRGALPQGGLSPLFHLFPNIFLISDQPLFVQGCLAAGAVLSVLLTIGRFDRIAAVFLWYLWACLYGRNPLIGNPSLPFIGWLLLAYPLIPGVTSRKNSGGNEAAAAAWKMPGDIFAAAWIVMAVAYSYSGYAKLSSASWIDGTAFSQVLHNPLARDTALRTHLLSLPVWWLKSATWFALFLELSFAPLSLFRKLRPYLWFSMAGMHLGLLALVNFSDLTLGMLLLHFFTFDPAWVWAPNPAGQTIFYDGNCGLCHGLVRFVLSEDRSPRPFSFAPLQGEAIKRTLTEEARAKLPDSIVVVDNDKKVLTRSTAVLYVMTRLGGLWSIAAAFLRLVPRALRDVVYDAVACVRIKFLGTTVDTCPMVPAPLRARFLL
ncbi:MAG TPA: DCC1-like thiol-disulfide oxidoreductase family protein [Terriglobales bacterium]|nr:DCC1-like thiol-disulfide oxidoreductase family protein [Terriglobales bacterium]